MSIKIGRAGRDTGLGLNSPRRWSVDGDDVDCEGALTGDSLGELVILRAQVAGLVGNRDEPVVAVSWAGDASVDGYYRVVSGGVAMPPRGLAARKLDYSLRLRKLSVYPRIESVLVGDTVRTNAHSIAKGTTVPWWAVPNDAVMDYIPGADDTTRATETGTVRVWYKTNGTVLYNRTSPWSCAASDYYDGACRFEVTPDGTSWVALVGRRLPNTHQQYGWRINNGLVRVSVSAGDGLVTVEHYVSGSWSVSKTYKLTVTTTPTTIGSFRTVTVKRNGPEAVTVRLGLDQANGAVPAAVTVDLTLRRGALWVEGVMSRTAEVVTHLANEMGVYRNTAEAATAITSGLRATSNDAAGGKYWMATSLAKTNNLTQGGFYVASNVNDFDFAIGYEPPSAGTLDTFTNQVYAYFAPLDESVGFSRR